MDLNRPLDTFVSRHIGPNAQAQAEMLATLGVASLDALVEGTLPQSIRAQGPLDIGEPKGELELAAQLRGLAEKNQLLRSFIGMGYYPTIVPPVIQRNVLENPGWYTQYTPYQAEIAQGRLEALLNFQTMIADLTGLPMANASLLDEGTAAAEAMAMAHAALRGQRTRFFVADHVHPQTLAVIQTRAAGVGVEVVSGELSSMQLDDTFFGALAQYPDTSGELCDVESFTAAVHQVGALAVVASDLLALLLLKPPGELGADIVVGSAQRFGVPMGYGGPHAGFLATTADHQRQMPGRVVGVSKDAQGHTAFRLALQTREQHIRREKATSNICTAQVLLAVMASMYAVYHGPKGLRAIAERVHGLTCVLAAGLRELGFAPAAAFFDTLAFNTPQAADILAAARQKGVNLRPFAEARVGLSLDELTTLDEVQTLLDIFAPFGNGKQVQASALASSVQSTIPERLRRTSEVLTHDSFNRYHSETEMLRYLHRLERKDLALNESMIPLGSCTMKLNGTTEMVPITLPGFAHLHPFAPVEQAQGYAELIDGLERMIGAITGFPGVSLQPNAGSQGELAGLLVIRAYHQARGESHRNVCLIPSSAHGTNPASAVMAGMKVVVVKCDDRGNIDVADLRAKASKHAAELGALMVTYPSTHGVFESTIREVCEVVHQNGGQVYMDGANLNAMVGLSRPADIGVDVCHLNLHKTFAIPHGGGGPGMGPIAGAEHLAPFMPRHPLVRTGGEQGIGAVSAAPWGSALILTISWAYMKLMGGTGLTQASQVAILSANYMAKRLEEHYPVLYRGVEGRVAHEFIIDLRPFKASAGVSVDDVAKRLMDYGFHAPTMSWPVAGTMMIEPTESESKPELDRFCDAMIAIREEIRKVEEGTWDPEDNPLRNAPHTAAMVCSDSWDHAYSREVAAYPMEHLRHHKFWPAAARIDNTYGDRHFVCTCPPIEEYA